MTTFLGVCLLVFAGWIALGMTSAIGRAPPCNCTAAR
jgi:hypothetical protein